MKTKINLQFQQGDCIIETATIPTDAIPVKSVVLAEGEGHHLHRFSSPQNVQVFEKDGIKYARVLTETKVEHVKPDGRHGEHNPLTVHPGEYTFGQISEYDYMAQMARNVVD